MAEESKNRNQDVISLEGIDLDLNPAGSPSQATSIVPGAESEAPPTMSPKELAENEFRKLKSNRDRDLSMYLLGKLWRLLGAPTGVLRRRWSRHLGEVQNFFRAQIQKVVTYVIYLKKGGYKDVILEFRRRILELIDKTKKSIQWLWQTPWSKKFYLLIFLGTIYLSYLLIVKIVSGSDLPGLHFEGVTTLEAVADEVFEFSPRAPMEQFDSPIRHSDHTVLLGKIIANLKTSKNSSPQPMGAFRFHFETSSRETAMELVDREKELLDLMQRTIEDFTWDELSTVDGKSRLKLVLRKKVNETLNRGRVKKVLIDTIVLKN